MTYQHTNKLLGFVLILLLVFPFISESQTGSASDKRKKARRAGIVNDTAKAMNKMVRLVTNDAMQIMRMKLASREMRKIGYIKKGLTKAEMKLFSKHPDKVDRIKEITDYVNYKTRIISRSDNTISLDAYKHVLWSFLLTKEYGPGFAREITDAHEKGDKTNTEAEHKMDYHNNKIGRDYALRGYKESEVLGLIEADPDIILKPEE